MPFSIYRCGRWGETGLKKGSVNLFSVEPTDETYITKKDIRKYALFVILLRKMGLEPTRSCPH